MNQLFRFPNAVRRDPGIEVWMQAHAGALGEIAQRWFAAMRNCGGDVRELLHDGHPTACVADAAFGYVNAFTAHVNVGFFRGAELADPAGLLEGTGKFMRHVKLRPGDDVNVEALTNLIEAAYIDMRERLQAEQHVQAVDRVFFYGLFMDTDLLREMKLKPVVLGPAELHGYRLRIGDRATLVPSPASIAYGMLIKLSAADLATLYSAAGVSDYAPEVVEVARLSDGFAQSALCYNLPPDKLGAQFNSEYAKDLSDLLIRLGFPADYASEVAQPGPKPTNADDSEPNCSERY